ncbi:MAG: TonB-dependent receptor [Ferruginibacter sp.]
MKTGFRHIYFFTIGLSICFSAKAQSVDTLPAVKLSAQKVLDERKTVLPAQQLNKEALAKLNSISVADAVKFFAGVLVKDYGGIGGLKTVSVRSLGASNTGVMYDGILLSDAQSGQVDLGKISLDNIESITLFNAQPVEILLPARSYASASILMLKTTVEKFDAERKATAKLALKAGSFGFANPSAFVQYHFTKYFYSSLSTEWQRANGSYPFKAYESGAGTAKRINSDINAFRLEYDAGYKMNDSNLIHFKVYFYNSDRGLPGSIVLYNDVSHQRLKDKNFFTQASWQKSFSPKSRVLLSGKYAYNYNYYLDPDYPNAQGKLENKFHQKEYYFSGAYEYKFSSLFSFAYASDVFVNRLTRSDGFVAGFAAPVRRTWLNNIAAKAKFNLIELQGNLLFTQQHDKVIYGNSARDIHVLTPTLALSYQPLKSLPLSIRAFYKNILRVPTFNDLYYTFVGNTNLRPEYAKQYNAGITYRQNSNGFVQTALFTADAYYNKVKDKILAVPRQNLFQWTILNIGAADIRGIDANIQLYFKEFNGVNLSTRFAYSFQKALDISDKTSALYKSQLPYTPEHSGSLSVNAGYKKISLSYNILLSSYRYQIGEPIQENLVKEWATQDVSLAYSFASKKNCRYKALLELNNIFNKQYEIIRYYPMPRFNYRAGISAEF